MVAGANLQTMIEWPAFLKCENDDELQFLPTEDAWLAYCKTSPARGGDRLIDSRGSSHVVKDVGATDTVVPQQLSLEQVLQLVRQHASVCGHCCVSKMGAPDIAQAVALVQEIN